VYVSLLQGALLRSSFLSLMGPGALVQLNMRAVLRGSTSDAPGLLPSSVKLVRKFSTDARLVGVCSVSAVTNSSLFPDSDSANPAPWTQQ
jgi:hypothetical protein